MKEVKELTLASNHNIAPVVAIIISINPSVPQLTPLN